MWLGTAASIEWLTSNGFDPRGQRSAGAFFFRVDALDPHGAADLVRQMVEQLLARASYQKGRGDRLRPAKHIWVKGHPKPIPLDAPTRGADVKALYHENYLYWFGRVGRLPFEHRPSPRSRGRDQDRHDHAPCRWVPDSAAQRPGRHQPHGAAGLDRLTHAVLTEGISPLHLAARAELSLALVDGETGLSVVELLEPLRHTRPLIPRQPVPL
jgi:hypothetical protein